MTNGDALTEIREWRPIREMIFWVVVCILVGIAAFEGGYIVGHRDGDRIKSEIRKLNSWILDHGGRIESLETMDRRDKTGIGKPPVKKEISK
jgi:hypothetical protein